MIFSGNVADGGISNTQFKTWIKQLTRADYSVRVFCCPGPSPGRRLASVAHRGSLAPIVGPMTPEATLGRLEALSRRHRIHAEGLKRPGVYLTLGA